MSHEKKNAFVKLRDVPYSIGSTIVLYHGLIIPDDISAFVCVPWNNLLQDVISGIVCDSAPPLVKYGVRSPKFICAPVYSCTHLLRPRNHPPPPSPAFGLMYEGAIGQPS